jgi:hypothetical protein
MTPYNGNYTTNGSGTVPSQQQPQSTVHPQPVQWGIQAVPPTYIHVAPQFTGALPLHGLNQGSAPVDCPVCRSRAMTITNFESGDNTQFVPLLSFFTDQTVSLWAIILCIFCGLGCIPYLTDSTKDVVHKCGGCGTLLAKWRRNGVPMFWFLPCLCTQ